MMGRHSKGIRAALTTIALLVAVEASGTSCINHGNIGSQSLHSEKIPRILFGAWEVVHDESLMIFSPDCNLVVVDWSGRSVARSKWRQTVMIEDEFEYGFVELVLSFETLGGDVRHQLALLFFASVGEEYGSTTYRELVLCFYDDPNWGTTPPSPVDLRECTQIARKMW